MKGSRWELISEHIRDVIVRADERNHQLHGLYHISNVEMASGNDNVLAAFMVFGVMRPLIVSGTGRRARRRRPQACQKFTEVDIRQDLSLLLIRHRSQLDMQILYKAVEACLVEPHEMVAPCHIIL